jgi:flagellar protein FliO/FliZ
VVDYASVDGRRRLILVRRDNVEHLLMIGGPSDVVVEPNIVRALTATRDAPGTRPPAGLDALPRAIPLPENGTNGTWPLQPEPAPRPAPRIEPLPDDLPPRVFPPLVDPAPRPQRDTLAALADELSTRPAGPPRSRPLTRPQPEEPSPDIFKEPPQDPHQDFETLAEAHPEPRLEPRAEPRKPVQPAAAFPPPAVSVPEAAEPASAADQSLTDMAQRLEAALRKPIAETRPTAPPARPTPQGEPVATTVSAPPPVPSRAPRTARDLTSSAELPPPSDSPTLSRRASEGFESAEARSAKVEAIQDLASRSGLLRFARNDDGERARYPTTRNACLRKSVWLRAAMGGKRGP